MAEVRRRRSPKRYGDVLSLGVPVPQDENRIRFLRRILATEAAVLALLHESLGRLSLTISAFPQPLDPINIKSLRFSVDNEFRTLSAQVATEIARPLPEVAKDGEDLFQDNLKKNLPKAVAAGIIAGLIAIAHDIASQSVEYGLKGEPLGDWVSRIMVNGKSTILKELTRGALLEKPTDEILTTIKQVLTGETIGNEPAPATAIFPSLAKMTRTEYAAAFNLALTSQGAQTNVLKGYLWELSKAHPRRDICDDKAGKVYRPDAPEVIDWPIHQNCLCYLAPVFNV